MIFFKGNAGTVLSMLDPGLQGVLPVFAINPAIGFQAQKSLITRITLAQDVNAQFLHTLGGDIFVYVFGDRVGQMTISGVCAARTCRNNDGTHGFEKMIQWYKANRLSSRKTPVTALIGRTPVTGFVVGLNGAAVNPERMLFQFDVSMVVLPDKPAGSRALTGPNSWATPSAATAAGGTGDSTGPSADGSGGDDGGDGGDSTQLTDTSADATDPGSVEPGNPPPTLSFQPGVFGAGGANAADAGIGNPTTEFTA